MKYHLYIIIVYQITDVKLIYFHDQENNENRRKLSYLINNTLKIMYMQV